MKELSHKLSASGHQVDEEEELVFYALDGLPPEYHSFLTSTRTRVEPIRFHELASLLGAEEMQIYKNQSS